MRTSWVGSCSGTAPALRGGASSDEQLAGRACGVLLALALVVTAAAPARAAELRVRAPADCAAAAAIGTQVESLIGGPLGAVERVDFDVEIAQREAGDFLLTLRSTLREAGAEPRTRQLLGASCDEVSDAAAVAIAMTITGSGAPPIAPAVEPKLTPAPETASGTGAAALQPSPWWFAAGVYALIDGGVLPAIAPGAQLELVGGWNSVSLRVSGAALAAQQARLPGDSGDADFSLFFASALLCGERAFDVLHGLACAGAELGSLSGSSDELDVPRGDRATVFAAVRAEVGLGFELQPGLSILARGGVSIPLTRREFQVNRGQTIHRAASLSGRALLGLQLTF